MIKKQRVSFSGSSHNITAQEEAVKLMVVDIFPMHFLFSGVPFGLSDDLKMSAAQLVVLALFSDLLDDGGNQYVERQK